jgi:hypothetical protein
MICTRCHGLMVPDHLFDVHGTSGHMWRRSERCMNCGHIHDAVIARHRGAGAAPVAGMSSEPDYHDEEVHLGMESYQARTA